MDNGKVVQINSTVECREIIQFKNIFRFAQFCIILIIHNVT